MADAWVLLEGIDAQGEHLHVTMKTAIVEVWRDSSKDFPQSGECWYLWSQVAVTLRLGGIEGLTGVRGLMQRPADTYNWHELSWVVPGASCYSLAF